MEGGTMRSDELKVRCREYVACILNRHTYLPWVSKRKVVRLVTELCSLWQRDYDAKSKRIDAEVAMRVAESDAKTRKMLYSYRMVVEESCKAAYCAEHCGDKMQRCNAVCSQRDKFLKPFTDKIISLTNDEVAELLPKEDKNTWQRIDTSK